MRKLRTLPHPNNNTTKHRATLLVKKKFMEKMEDQNQIPDGNIAQKYSYRSKGCVIFFLYPRRKHTVMSGPQNAKITGKIAKAQKYQKNGLQARFGIHMLRHATYRKSEGENVKKPKLWPPLRDFFEQLKYRSHTT